MKVVHKKGYYLCEFCSELFEWSEHCFWFGSYNELENNPKEIKFFVQKNVNVIIMIDRKRDLQQFFISANTAQDLPNFDLEVFTNEYIERNKITQVSQKSLDLIELNQTCGACPEQYDAFYKGQQVGYLRLRHGYFRVDFPDSSGEKIYDSNTLGDGLFDSSERDDELRNAKTSICIKLGLF